METLLPKGISHEQPRSEDARKIGKVAQEYPRGQKRRKTKGKAFHIKLHPKARGLWGRYKRS